jgi:hypothetical protein
MGDKGMGGKWTFYMTRSRMTWIWKEDGCCAATGSLASGLLSHHTTASNGLRKTTGGDLQARK